MTKVLSSAEPMPVRRANYLWGLAGVLLLFSCLLLSLLSRDFGYGSPMGDRPIPAVVAILMLMGGLYLLLQPLLARSTVSPGLVSWIVATGALMRLITALSQPILEDDWYRYLWDGALTAHGVNPYGVIPGNIQSGETMGPPSLRALAADAGVVLERINHAELGTIYPPAAQAGFALAHWIAPWQPSGLKTVYFATDCLALWLLLALLIMLDRSPAYAVLYWWNPLVIKETYNSMHMDVLLAPILLLSLLFALRNRVSLSALALALATAVKLWPILLLPPLLAIEWRRPRRLIAAGALFAVVTLVLLGPMAATARLGKDAGLVAYGQRWEMNDALFMLFPWMVRRGADLVHVECSTSTVHRAGRAIVAALVLAVSLRMAWVTARTGNGEAPEVRVGMPSQHRNLALPWSWIAAALFLLSPTQFPWYFCWLAPLLAMAPNRALLLLTMMLPLYYLKFYYTAMGDVAFFHQGIVWIEYVPVWLLLVAPRVARVLPYRRATLATVLEASALERDT